ncbi:MAG: archaetidylserine decarboxylase [Pseudomonadales bacterium]|nr:archaetidylserine decarboxylase [Pseudomonadales bacterium]
MKEFLFTLAQFLLPHHLLSRLIGYLAECRWHWLKNTLIKQFIDAYKVNMSEAAKPDPKSYACFNDFFSRALKPDARTFPEQGNEIACPADGTISQLGDIEQGRIFQAKGHNFSARELLGGTQELADQFDGGKFATIYLSPKDYHRVHMPLAGELKQMIYVPGRLFSVSPLTTSQIPRLFARNERMVALFDTEQGPMAIIMVGAMIVASIETVWAGLVTPPKRQLQAFQYGQPIKLKQGEEMGQFKLGSTVILLFGKDVMSWKQEMYADRSVVLGETLGELNN